MWRNNKKEITAEQDLGLVLPFPGGEPWVAFPPGVIDPVRRLISRLGRIEEIPPRLSFVSALRREGVTYISWAFATTMAYDLATSVCIVDLNWAWPSSLLSNIPASAGLGAVLSGELLLDHAIVRTGKANLAILPAGDLPIHQRAHYARSANLKDTIQELSARFDHLILDVPAVLASSDAIPLASLGTTCCLVLQQGVTTMEEVKSALNDCEHISNLGVVMNRYRSATPEFLRKLISL